MEGTLIYLSGAQVRYLSPGCLKLFSLAMIHWIINQISQVNFQSTPSKLSTFSF